MKVGDLVKTVKSWGWHSRTGIVIAIMPKNSKFGQYEVLWHDGETNIMWDYHLEIISESPD